MKTSVCFLEPEINNSASRYIINNYDEIVKNVLKFGVHKDKAEDLVHDVYISVVEAEKEGLGFDMNKSKTGDYIVVSNYIYGKLKGYSKSSKYRTDIVDYREIRSKNKKDFVIVMAGSANDNTDYDVMSSFQKAYNLAPSYDSLEDVEERLSIRERIEFCMEFDDVIKMNILEFFRNLDALRKVDINKSIFNGLKEALNYHDEFADAFRGVLRYYANNRSDFDHVIHTI